MGGREGGKRRMCTTDSKVDQKQRLSQRKKKERQRGRASNREKVRQRDKERESTVKEQKAQHGHSNTTT